MCKVIIDSIDTSRSIAINVNYIPYNKYCNRILIQDGGNYYRDIDSEIFKYQDNRRIHSSM